MTGADRVKVVTDQGPLTAQAVIVTAPMTVLAAGDITFGPRCRPHTVRLSPTCRSASSTRSASPSTPTSSAERRPTPWSRDTEDTDRFGLGLAKMAGTPMMNLFVAEDLARELEAGGDAAVEAYAQRVRHRHFGAAAAAASIAPSSTPWGTDPLTMGSYSAARVGKVGARATLAEPIDDRLYFAGEAISTKAHSSLHGAYLTGQDAAMSIFDHLDLPLDSVG